MSRLMVPGSEARKLRLQRGERLKICTPRGGQVADLIAFHADDLGECGSPPQTRRALMSIRLRVGDALYSNRGRALLRLVHDSVGVHDLLAPACDDFRYRVDYGVVGHASRVGNSVALMAEHGLQAHDLPDPLNVFEAVPVAADGSLGIMSSPAPPGGCAVFVAERPCVVCVSACPQDLAPTNHYRVTELELTLEP